MTVQRRVELTSAALADLGRLKEDDPELAAQALRLLRRLERREVDGMPLAEMAVTGDLSDCRKLYFGGANGRSHRVVYRQLPDHETVEVLEVVVVESRSEMYVYLLASQRMGRLPTESGARFTRLHQATISRRGAARKQGRQTDS